MLYCNRVMQIVTVGSSNGSRIYWCILYICVTFKFSYDKAFFVKVESKSHITYGLYCTK
jgi:hypothetical protein